MSSVILFESLVAGAATLLGAITVCCFGRPRARLLAGFMGFAAGVMACVVIFDLLPYSYSFGSLLYTLTGFWLGVLLMQILSTGVGFWARRRLRAREEKARREAARQIAWAKRQQELAKARVKPVFAAASPSSGRKSYVRGPSGWQSRPAAPGTAATLWVSADYRSKAAAAGESAAPDAAAGPKAAPSPAADITDLSGAKADPASSDTGKPSDTSLLKDDLGSRKESFRHAAQEKEVLPEALPEEAVKDREILSFRDFEDTAGEPEAAPGTDPAGTAGAAYKNNGAADFKAHPGRYFQLGLLVAVGIALHDLPEGMAIAAGHTAQKETGVMLALAIGLHNIPEGIASATPFVMAGTKRRWILFTMLIISFFTPLGAWLGLLLLSLGPQLISILLALAAGAMISLVIREMIPEAWAVHKLTACLGFLAGCALLLFMTFSLHH